MTREERYEVVKEVINILAKHSLSVSEAESVLKAVEDDIALTSKVQEVKD